MSDIKHRQIDLARCESAINFLSDTDEEAAQLKVEVSRIEDKIAAMKAAIFMRCEGSVELRKCTAEDAPEVYSEREKLYVALLKFEHVRNRRGTAARVTELYQTIASNRRAGMQS